MPKRGRDRSVGHYRTTQRHLPALYGVGELGLSRSAPAERRARAKQLQAYLLFFDQLLANHLAQLENVGRLFANEGEELKTYFSQLIDEPELAAVVTGNTDDRRRKLADITDPDAASADGTSGASRRKHRFLNHLLARFGEEFTDYSLLQSDATSSASEKLIRDKQAFLGRYPHVSGGRGTARDDLAPTDPANSSGLENRIALKLGLDRAKGESLLLIEHILLRPMVADAAQVEPLLAAARRQDPYSLQLSIVFPNQGRLSGTVFRRFAERTVREETPAHLIPYVHWMPADPWAKLHAAYREWLEQRQEYLASRAGVMVERSEA